MIAARRDSPAKVEAGQPHKGIVSVLQRALECCVRPAPDFRDPEWWFQGIEDILRVYGRRGEDCKPCNIEVRLFEQSGRSAYFCGHCQKRKRKRETREFDGS